MTRIKSGWYDRTWRPSMAYLYFFLCLLDYGVRPVVNTYFFRQFNLSETVSQIRELDASVQIQIVDTLRSKEAISPILTEFVHLSFGAILGVAAFTRGREEIERVKRSPVTPTGKNPNTDEKDDEAPVNKVEEADDGAVG